MTTFTIILVLVIAIVAIASINGAKKRRKFNEGYLEFLSKNDGLEIFCYTNRERFCGAIESELIPKLGDHIHVVKLIGKEPQTELDKSYISFALYNLQEIGFPNVMKIINGRIIDLSLHKSIYDSINNNRVDTLPSLVNRKFDELRKMA